MSHFVFFVFQKSVRHADGHLRQGPDRPVLPAHSQAVDEPDLSGKKLGWVRLGKVRLVCNSHRSFKSLRVTRLSTSTVL
jgi:hypothetical protein